MMKSTLITTVLMVTSLHLIHTTTYPAIQPGSQPSLDLHQPAHNLTQPESKQKKRLRRFVLHDSRWEKNDFTWRYDKQREVGIFVLFLKWANYLIVWPPPPLALNGHQSHFDSRYFLSHTCFVTLDGLDRIPSPLKRPKAVKRHVFARSLICLPTLP